MSPPAANAKKRSPPVDMLNGNGKPVVGVALLVSIVGVALLAYRTISPATQGDITDLHSHLAAVAQAQTRHQGESAHKQAQSDISALQAQQQAADKQVAELHKDVREIRNDVREILRRLPQ